MVQSNTITITVTAPPTVSSITITASASSVNTGQTVTISGIVMESNGSAAANQTVTLVDSTTGGTLSTTTDSSGNYSMDVVFNTAGTYQLYTET